ncbi:MAG TPA: hypothetical protein VIV57_11155 [Anaeromyxobacter sp.]
MAAPRIVASTSTLPMSEADAAPARYGSAARDRFVAWQGYRPAEDGVMWNPASPTRSALAFLMAAAVAFLGSAMLLRLGRAFPQLTGGVPATGRPGMLLLAVVILLVVSGLLLVAMAGKEFLDLRRASRAVSGTRRQRDLPG